MLVLVSQCNLGWDGSITKRMCLFCELQLQGGCSSFLFSLFGGQKSGKGVREREKWNSEEIEWEINKGHL